MPRRSPLFLFVSAALAALAPAARSQPPAPEKPADKPAAQPAAPALPRTPSGKGLVIPDDQKKLGTPYYTISTGVKQVTVTSEAARF